MNPLDLIRNAYAFVALLVDEVQGLIQPTPADVVDETTLPTLPTAGRGQ